MSKKIGVSIWQKICDTFGEEISPPTSPPTDPSSLKSHKIHHSKRGKNKEPPVSNIDKVLEYLNKRQRVTTSSLDSVEMLMLIYAKTIKTFSLRRPAIAKKRIAEIIYNLEIEQIDGKRK